MKEKKNENCGGYKGKKKKNSIKSEIFYSGAKEKKIKETALSEFSFFFLKNGRISRSVFLQTYIIKSINHNN